MHMQCLINYHKRHMILWVHLWHGVSSAITSHGQKLKSQLNLPSKTHTGTCLRCPYTPPGTCYGKVTHLPHTATRSTADHTAGREHTFTWYLVLQTPGMCGTIAGYTGCKGFPTLVFMCVYVCVSHSSTPTSLCRHGFFLSSNTMLFLFFSLSLFLSNSLSLSGNTALRWAWRLSAPPSTYTRFIRRRELPSSLPLSPLPSFLSAF